MKLVNEEEPISEINVTPFVDIILVVLIIFMVTTPLIMQPSLQIQLPKAATGESTNPSPFEVHMGQGGQILLNNQEVSLDTLAQEAQRLFLDEPDLRAVISADKNVPHGEVIAVIDAIKSAGISKFAITTQSE